MTKHCKLSHTTVKNMRAGSRIAKGISCPYGYKCVNKGRRKAKCKYELNL